MSEKGSSELGSFLAGFVIGGLVGAATALILAPQSGSDTRAKISNRGQEFRTTSSEHIHHVTDSASTYAHEYGDRMRDANTRVQEQARIVLDKGKHQTETLVEENASQNGIPEIDIEIDLSAEGDASANDS